MLYRKTIKFNHALLAGTCCLSVILLFSLFLLNNTCLAQESIIEIEVNTNSEPVSALGMFFDSEKIIQQPKTEIEKVSPNLLVVRMPYDRSINLNSGFATAYITDKDEKLHFGSVKILPPGENTDSVWKLPACPGKSRNLDVRIPVQEQLSYLDSLYQIRLKKRELLRNEIKQKLDERTLASLQEIENRFGLKYEKGLLDEDVAYNLHIRLRKLRDTIQLYKYSKSRDK